MDIFKAKYCEVQIRKYKSKEDRQSLMMISNQNS